MSSLRRAWWRGPSVSSMERRLSMYCSGGSSRLTKRSEVKISGFLSTCSMSAYRVTDQKPRFGLASGFQDTGASRRRVSNIPQASLRSKTSRSARSTSSSGTRFGGCMMTPGFLEVVGVLAELPVGDEPLEPLDLIALIGQERADEVAAQDFGQGGVSLERVQGDGQGLREDRGGLGVVSVALERGGEFGLVPDAQVGGGGDGRDDQVRVGGGVAQPDLHPGAGPPLRRDAEHRAAV